MQKKLLYSNDARNKMKSGIDKTCDMVKVTLGANGRTVAIKHSYIDQVNGGIRHLPLEITKDGVTVARNIMMDDSIENMGCDLVKDAANKTMEQIGDCTTTTCVLLQALVAGGIELIDGGANPHELKKGIDSAVESVILDLKKSAIPVISENKDEFLKRVKQVATISANNDESIGQLIADAFEKIGVSGAIDLRDSKSYDTTIEIEDGYKIGSGWMSQYFVTDLAKMECVLHNPYILLFDKAISDHLMKELENVIKLVIPTGRPLLVICEDMTGKPFATLAANSYRKEYQFCVVKSPGFQNSRIEHMEDLALITGGEFISDEKGKGLKSVKLTDLGQAEKVVISIDETVIINGNSQKDRIVDLKNSLKMDMVKATPLIKEQIEKRIASLDGGVAVMYVGANSDAEMKEKKARCDDAIKATKAAIADGYVIGGGAAFAKLSYYNWLNNYTDFQLGEKLVKKAISTPFLQILDNSGANNKEEIIEITTQTNSGNLGYNAKTNRVEDLIDAGVIDPVKGLRCALQNAASVAGTFLTIEGVICSSM